MAADQRRAERIAGHTTADDAEHGRRDRDHRCAIQARRLEQWREGEARRRPADQGHRTGHQPEQRRLPEGRRNRHADTVLHDADRDGEQQEYQHRHATPAQQREARAHADGGEESDVQRELRAGVEAQIGPAVAQDKHQQRKGEPAHHRRGNVQPVEHRDPLAQLHACKIDHGRQRQGLQQVEFQVEHGGGECNTGG